MISFYTGVIETMIAVHEESKYIKLMLAKIESLGWEYELGLANITVNKSGSEYWTFNSRTLVDAVANALEMVLSKEVTP